MSKRVRSTTFLMFLMSMGCSSAELSPDVTTIDDRDDLESANNSHADAGKRSLPQDFTATIDREEAVRIAEEIVTLFRPSAEARSATLSVEPNWENPAGIFGSMMRSEYDWYVEPKGALLTPYLTRDSMRLVTCHEMGHFFGGFPFSHAGPALQMRGKDLSKVGTWLGSEGTSDYFATKSCLALVWKGDRNNPAYRALVPAKGKKLCDQVWKAPEFDQDRRDVCYRTIVVARELGRLASGSAVYDMSIDTPDTSVVSETNLGYPSHQCRFDTLVAGALCNPKKPATAGVIPGLVKSELTGYFGDHSVQSENESADYSCYTGPGKRPACWFVPHMPEEDCGNGIGWSRCEEDNAVLAYCKPGAGTTRLTCIDGCTKSPYSAETGEDYVCKEDLPDEEAPAQP